MLRGEISLERIAALEPDLVIAVASGISPEQYDLLSRLCPVIAPPAGQSDYDTPWEVRAEIAGRATGNLEIAERRIAGITGRLNRIAAEHPGWAGQTAALAYVWGGAPGAFTSADPRAALLERMGFATPEAIDAATREGAFFTALSPENLAPIDAGLLIWVDDGGTAEAIRDLPLRETLRAHAEGREILADAMLAGALSHASLLSLPYAIDALVPEIEAAADGDPATGVPSAAAAGLTP